MDNVLEKINKSTLSILSSQSVQEVCQIIVEEGKSLTSAEQGAIYLQKNDKLEIVYSSASDIAQIRVKKRGYLQKSVKKGDIVTLHTQELEKIDPLFIQVKIKSLIIIPLMYHKKAIGALTLHSSKEEFFTDKELDIMKLFRSVASIALEKTQLYAQTQQALETRDRFISLASHELRTPLTSINGYIQLLHSKLSKTDSVESRWVKELYGESVRLTNLVKELLDINRIKQGQLQFLLREIDLGGITKKAIERFNLVDAEHEIIFMDDNNEQGYMVVGDAEKLMQMILALLGNAVKFSKPHTRIHISLASKNRFVILRVRDEGKGIPKADLQRIFEGFYKAKNVDNKEGMGVGLLLAKHLVEHHKGKLTVASKLGKGTIVEVKLPQARI